MIPNNTYASFERFTRVVEDLGLMETEVTQVAGAYHTLQSDLEALLAIYDDKEAWYKEQNETTRSTHSGLSQVRYEYRRVDATRRLLRADLTGVGTTLETIGGKYQQRQSQLEALRHELNSELQWLQEVVGSLDPPGESRQQSAHSAEATRKALSQGPKPPSPIK